jgi:hypothetical protein
LPILSADNGTEVASIRSSVVEMDIGILRTAANHIRIAKALAKLTLATGHRGMLVPDDLTPAISRQDDTIPEGRDHVEDDPSGHR